MGLVDRVFLLSYPEFYVKNLEFVVKILLENDYPLTFIFDTISDRIKSLICHKTGKQKDNIVNNFNDLIMPWFVLPYVRTFSEKFNIITKDLKTEKFFYSINKLNVIIKANKDLLPNEMRKKCCL